MKKISILLILVVMILSACGPNTWVLEKERLGEVDEVESYVSNLQNDRQDFRGYRIFTISEGKKMVVVSTGSSDTSLNFVEAAYPDENTTITVEEVSNNSNEENAYILVGIGEIKGELTVLEQHGDEFSVK